MIEKVNPSHPDKLADRIAGAIVDYAYTLSDSPKIAVEVLLGHGCCHIMIETSEKLNETVIERIVDRIAGPMTTTVMSVSQDEHLADNQKERVRCGDNGIFKGVPLTDEQVAISKLARFIYSKHPSDGKYIIDGRKVVICQSNAHEEDLRKEAVEILGDGYELIINPLGEWTGGASCDCGATNRKLGSDMADSVTGGGLHGKDLSKADVSANICAFLEAHITGRVQEFSCAIGDETINGVPYEKFVNIARNYVRELGGFEKLAEWGLY